MVDRVICDEIFYIEDDEFDIPPIGEIVVPPGSTIEGIVTVTVMNCTPAVDLVLNLLEAELVFMVQKELTIITPDEGLIPLEFGFRLARSIAFRKCFPPFRCRQLILISWSGWNAISSASPALTL